jgi:hypothetical protein
MILSSVKWRKIACCKSFVSRSDLYFVVGYLLTCVLVTSVYTNFIGELMTLRISGRKVRMEVAQDI